LNGKSYSSKTESYELWKVGKEIGIRKRIKINSNTTEIKDKLEDLEEIKIGDWTQIKWFKIRKKFYKSNFIICIKKYCWKKK